MEPTERPEQWKNAMIESVCKVHLTSAGELPPDTLFVTLETATSLYALPWFNRN